MVVSTDIYVMLISLSIKEKYQHCFEERSFLAPDEKFSHLEGLCSCLEEGRDQSSDMRASTTVDGINLMLSLTDSMQSSINRQSPCLRTKIQLLLELWWCQYWSSTLRENILLLSLANRQNSCSTLYAFSLQYSSLLNKSKHRGWSVFTNRKQELLLLKRRYFGFSVQHLSLFQKTFILVCQWW